MKRRQPFHAAGYSDSGLLLKKIEFTAKTPVSPCRIVFFSDTHFRADPLFNFSPGSFAFSWTGTSLPGNALIRTISGIAPDILIFGGDLVSHTVLYPEAFSILERLHAPVKLAVPGNWELKQNIWLPPEKVADGFRNAGFQFLRNQSVVVNGIQFSGVDDFRFGKPEIPAPETESGFRCIISHNPDLIGKSTSSELSGYHLALCGHTHGGQIRIPLFGAVKTSSVYWKRFEYGLYSEPGKPLTAVTSGIGGTCLRARFNCPPEILIIEFK